MDVLHGNTGKAQGRFYMSQPLWLIVGSCLHEGEPNMQDVWGCEVGVCYVKAC